VEAAKRKSADERFVDVLMALVAEGKGVAEESAKILLDSVFESDWGVHDRPRFMAICHNLQDLPLRALPSADFVRDVVGFKLALRDLDNQLQEWVSVCIAAYNEPWEMRDVNKAATKALSDVQTFHGKLLSDYESWRGGVGKMG
jgi:hypothetical protein